MKKDGCTRYIPNDSQASGTLGAIVRVGAAGDGYILTNQHVLDDGSNLSAGACDVYDPHRKTRAGIDCNNPVAQISANSGIRGMRFSGCTRRRHRDGRPLVRAGLDATPALPYFVYEERVSRAGAAVTQAFRRARRPDDRPIVWLGVTTRPGRGEHASGLAFDTIDTITGPLDGVNPAAS